MDDEDDLPMDGEDNPVDGPTLEPEVVEEQGDKEPEAPPAPEPDNVPVKALQDERRKRQELEQQIAALQQQVNQKPEEPAPSMWEDENKWQEHFGTRITQQATQFASQNARLDTSEMLARQAHAEDFEEAKAEFLKMAEQNPELRQAALSDPHPWEKAYQIYANAKAMKELGATNVADLEAKIRAKVEEELKANAPKLLFPTSTAQDGSVSGRSGAVWSGETKDRDILPMG